MLSYNLGKFDAYTADVITNNAHKYLAISRLDYCKDLLLGTVVAAPGQPGHLQVSKVVRQAISYEVPKSL